MTRPRGIFFLAQNLTLCSADTHRMADRCYMFWSVYFVQYDAKAQQDRVNRSSGGVSLLSLFFQAEQDVWVLHSTSAQHAVLSVICTLQPTSLTFPTAHNTGVLSSITNARQFGVDAHMGVQTPMLTLSLLSEPPDGFIIVLWATTLWMALCCSGAILALAGSLVRMVIAAPVRHLTALLIFLAKIVLIPPQPDLPLLLWQMHTGFRPRCNRVEHWNRSSSSTILESETVFMYSHANSIAFAYWEDKSHDSTVDDDTEAAGEAEGISTTPLPSNLRKRHKACHSSTTPSSP